MSNEALIQDSRPIATIVANAVNNIVEGNINPIQAYAYLTTFERAIAQIKDNAKVHDIIIGEIEKYGKQGVTIGELVFTTVEAGVKYDYSECGSSTYAELIEQRKALDVEIKEWEKVLKGLPSSGLADPNTGEMLYPPVKTSKTIVKTTTKR